MIILLGASGFVGGAFQRYFESQGVPFRGVGRKEVNYSDTDCLVRLLKEARPRFLICAAGYTGKPNVDACEIHKWECLSGNAVFPGVVREACERMNVPWGHVSSGCIFTEDKGLDGEGHRIGFTEEDAPNFSFRQDNCSFYSGTKALGEEILGYDSAWFSAVDSRHANGLSSITSPSNGYVWRLRIPFNNEETPRNYLTKLMRYQFLLEATNSLSQLQEFVRACCQCFEKRLPFGLYNVTNPGYVTTHEVVGLIRKSGVCNKEYIFFKDEADFMQKAAKTPRSNCVLDSSKILQHGIQLTEVHEAIEIALRNWKPISQV